MKGVSMMKKLLVVLVLAMGMLFLFSTNVRAESMDIAVDGWISGVTPVITDAPYFTGMSITRKTYTNSDGRVFYLTIMHLPNTDDICFAKYFVPTSATTDVKIKIVVDGLPTSSFTTTKPTTARSNIADITEATFLNFPDGSLYLRPSERYTNLGYTTYDWDPTGNMPVTVAVQDGTTTCTIDMKTCGNKFASTWFVISHSSKLLDPTDKNQAKFSPFYELTSYQRLFSDGSYENAPLTCTPVAQHGFWLNPAAIPGNWILDPDVSKGIPGRIGEDIVYALAYGKISTQLADGSWTIAPMSQWLKGLYGISYNYFDDRRGTDGVLFLMRFANKYKQSTAWTAVGKYDAFLMKYVSAHGTKIANGGVLVPDYYSASEFAGSHIALNHQLAQINFCFETGIATHNTTLIALGKTLLQGINGTAKLWVMPDHNLYYSVTNKLAHGPGTDYIYLTRDDLVRTDHFCSLLSLDDSTVYMLLINKNQWLAATGH
jgi:hypothetical protein